MLKATEHPTTATESIKKHAWDKHPDSRKYMSVNKGFIQLSVDVCTLASSDPIVINCVMENLHKVIAVYKSLIQPFINF